MVYVSVQEQFAENTNKTFHVCRVIVVLHIYHKMFELEKQDLLQTKIKV